MMKASELRIGNYVEYRNNGFPVCLIGVNNTTVYYNYDCFSTIDQMNGIPLNEEWLLKLGFNKEYEHGWIGIDFGNTDFVLSTPTNFENSTGKYTWFFRQGRVPLFKALEYVHELQNLFFAITGQELKIVSANET